MKRIFKLLLFFTATNIFLLIALSVRITQSILMKNPQHALSVLAASWAKIMLWILNIKVNLKGEQNNFIDTHYLIASNHQSYLDVIVIASKIPTLFVAKKEVQSWPILGWLASWGGTLYIDRKSFRGTLNSVNDIENALHKKISVTIFPEGTSSNGETIFPFRSSLFNAALASKSLVLPLSLNYEMIDNASVGKSNRDFICWYNGMTFINHFWKLLSVDSIEVSILVHPIISTAYFPNSKELSTVTYNVINNGFNRLS